MRMPSGKKYKKCHGTGEAG
ncbi:MAG: SEC-C domain-containing protein [Deltaproteobacteria bacterium]|nr:SEC-C domain-containing protein [Deltaproteobacteria bacterium]